MLCEIVECDLALHDPQLAELILSLSQHYLRKARTQLSKASELWQPHATKLSEEIRRAFPLTRVVAQSVAEPEPPAETQAPSSSEVPV